MSDEPPSRWRCDGCGCQTHLRAVEVGENLATPEQRAPIYAEARETGDWDAARERLAQYGTRSVWAIAYTCPGCGSLGTYYGTPYPREEAEALVETQNRLAATPEARAAAERWEEEVARRADHDARAFAARFRLRFPQWADRVPEPGAPGSGDPEDARFVLMIRPLSEHPSVQEPMSIRVQGGEVLVSWIHGWHWHLFRGSGAALEDLEHLDRALDTVEQVVTEQLSIVALYRGEQLVSGGGLQPGTDPPLDYLKREGPGTGDRFVIVSWRGTDDREIRRPEESPGPESRKPPHLTD